MMIMNIHDDEHWKLMMKIDDGCDDDNTIKMITTSLFKPFFVNLV